ncbi:bifunctional lysylphosphatidylglycerol synthetase/lysine--tRNA ligase LysX [Streptomyces xiamenensis]|uniref:bifunctional lysylphosphatidylglycerol synthetase/lysine--tRNA ligase LysX n=1 Tax=Streptomyces xiamenensis TaxID=408015 RepID=UPI0037D38EE7
MAAGQPRRTGGGSWRLRVPAWIAVVFTGVALVCAVSALIAGPRRWLERVREGIDVLLLPSPPSLPYAVFLLLLAAAVAARKRVAWWVLTGYTVVLVVVDVLPVDRHPVLQTVLGTCCAVLFLVLLLVTRPVFRARVRRGAFWRALGALVAGLIAATAAGWLLVTVWPGTLAAGDRPAYAANRVFFGLVADRYFSGMPPWITRSLLDLVAALALLNAAAVLFRSQRARSGLHPGDELRLRALLGRYGAQDSLGYFATRRDKNVVFSPDGRAAVTYRVEAGVCLASGDPVGRRGSWAAAIAAWQDLARDYAWSPAVLGAGPEAAQAYAHAGLGALHLGDEAIVEPAGFGLEGRDRRAMRQAVARVRRSGAVVRVRHHRELGEEEMAGVRADVDAWRGEGIERGFSMALGRLGDPADGACLLVEAYEGPGDGARRLAVLSFVPWGPDGFSLDVMRRDPRGPNGVIEFMIAELAERGRTTGIRRLSLNFAVFRSVFEEGARIGAGPVLRLWRRLLLFGSRWWQLEAMYRTNARYRPEWYPRYLCYAEPRALARIGVASGVIEGYVWAPPGRRRPGSHPPAAAGNLPPLSEEDLALARGTGPPARTALRPEGEREPEPVRLRRAAVGRLRAEGTDPYPPQATRTHTLAQARAAPAGTRAQVFGRVLAVRDFGGLAFAPLRDATGDLQLILGRESGFTATVRRGDHVEATGERTTSRTGEPSLRVSGWRLLSAALRPLPDRPAVRAVLMTRATVLHALRATLDRAAYTEVETPILQRAPGGAMARPFTTYGNAQHRRLALRVAPELYLKRLCVAGLDRIYELGRVFRNEGVSARHSPEFTLLEAYRTGADHASMRVLAHRLVQDVVAAAGGAARDLSGPWPVRTVCGALSEALGEEVTPDTPARLLHRWCARHGIPAPSEMDRPALIDLLYAHLVEARTGAPVFYTGFPVELSPLARADRADPRLAERWDLVAYGIELGTGCSELTDPVEQRRRLAARGAPDEDFLAALERGMAPTGGLGIGVDRLLMLLTGKPLRGTLPFGGHRGAP